MHPGTPRRPRRVVLRALGLGIGSLFAAGLLLTGPAAVSGWNQSSAETTLWQLLNGARANNGRAPLQQNGTLVSLARWRSSDMLAKSYFSHTIVGCGCLVYAYYDSNGLSYDWAGENIGWNAGHSDSYSPVRVHEAFMESPGHRANVLDPSFTHGGVGAAAADNQSFLGNVQSTRMYTELFMEAKSSGGGGGGSGGGGSGGGGSGGGGSGGGGGGSGGGSGGGAAPAQPTPKPEPVAQRASMDNPQRPVSSDGLDGRWTGVARDASGTDLIDRWLGTGPEPVAATAVDEAPGEGAVTAMQVEAPPREAGPLDGILGAILGFLFG